jgi:hypothetical protein
MAATIPMNSNLNNNSVPQAVRPEVVPAPSGL